MGKNNSEGGREGDGHGNIGQNDDPCLFFPRGPGPVPVDERDRYHAKALGHKSLRSNRLRMPLPTLD